MSREYVKPTEADLDAMLRYAHKCDAVASGAIRIMVHEVRRVRMNGATEAYCSLCGEPRRIEFKGAGAIFGAPSDRVGTRMLNGTPPLDTGVEKQ